MSLNRPLLPYWPLLLFLSFLYWDSLIPYVSIFFWKPVAFQHSSYIKTCPTKVNIATAFGSFLTMNQEYHFLITHSSCFQPLNKLLQVKIQASAFMPKITPKQIFSIHWYTPESYACFTVLFTSQDTLFNVSANPS